MDKLLLSPAEAGELLGVSEDTMRQLYAKRRLPGVYVSERGLKFYPAHVAAFADELAEEAEHEMQAQRERDRAWRRRAATGGTGQKRGPASRRTTYDAQTVIA